VDGKRTALVTVSGTVGAPYIAGYLALREGPLLEQVVRQLAQPPEVLLVDATGLDHPRRAGLAIHVGAVLDLPTVGVTDRTLLARISEPDISRGAMAPLTIDGEVVGYGLRTQDGVKPVLVHAGWRTTPDTAARVVLAVTYRVRTPEPLREARRMAKDLRARFS
jgi:deoxyribonuclease V